MAKRAKKTQPANANVPAEELQRVIKEFARQSASATEYAGHAGQVVKSAVERYNLDRKAFRFILGLSKMEETKRQATLRGVLEYSHKLEMFASVDAFDDLIDTMETIISEVKEMAGKARPIDPAISALGQMQ